ncbi:MAG: ABC transporter permease [Chloroflexi bacterium]|nr:ABC transporter permease [Anaerolineaceae bacterium]NLI44093.1 ABC transporter permease [Chloroflexota bacterium]HOE35500.1 ABC transporter permease [Anaerolineaceae bacterium]HOT26162.1 ABC transporter permease [Anaerolineaceae bacterium]HQH58509.1 ABC transporter permease [Anaerolineaceae bacterium]
MAKYILRRLISVIPTLIGVTLVIFLFQRLIPGDPAVAMLGEHATEENVARIREQFGLNRPAFLDRDALVEGDLPGFFDSQYVRYFSRLLRFDLGDSIHRRIPVAQTLKERFPATLELALLSMFIALLVGIPIGIASASRRNSWLDGTTMIGSLLGVSIPIFWLGIMEIMLFSVFLKWLPSGSRLSPGVSITPVTNLLLLDSLLTGNFAGFWDALKHIIMPAVALATIPTAIITRMTRSSMLDVLQEDYIRTASAKGLSERVVLYRHALKNAFLPVITIIGIQAGSLLAGAVLTETIFSWPGIGKWVYDSILGRDYPIVQGVTLLIAIIFLLVNLLVDISYALLDPRISYD